MSTPPATLRLNYTKAKKPPLFKLRQINLNVLCDPNNSNVTVIRERS